jgi:hypothetical protein
MIGSAPYVEVAPVTNKRHIITVQRAATALDLHVYAAHKHTPLVIFERSDEHERASPHPTHTHTHAHAHVRSIGLL